MNCPLSLLRRWLNVLPLRFWESLPMPARKRTRTQLAVEILEERILMTFNPPNQVLPTSQAPLDVQLGRLTGSGYVDMAILGSDGEVTTALNNGTGYWKSTQTQDLGIGPANGMVLTPLGTSAFPDLIIQGPNGLYVAKDDGSGHFTLTQTLNPLPADDLAPSGGGHVQLAAGAFSQNLYGDVATVAPATNQLLVSHATVAGTLGSPDLYAAGVNQPIAVVEGDFISAGAIDLAVAGRDGSVAFLQGTSGGLFQPRPDLTVTGLGTITGLTIGNFDGGGTEVAVSSSTGVYVLSNEHNVSPVPVHPLTNSNFAAGLSNWTATGPVTASNGFVQLQENSNGLLTTLQQSFLVPENPTTLSFNLAALNLENPDGAVPDAFEASLLDGQQNSVVPTINANATSFFNANPGGVYSTAPGVTFNGSGVTLDISHLTPGSKVTLYFDLIGNPPGESSTATIGNVQVNHLPPPQTFTVTSLAGTPTAGIAAGDVDGNGTIDLVATEPGADALAVYSNNGQGNFTPSTISLSTYGTNPAAVAVAPLTAGASHDDIALTLAGSNEALSPLILDTTPPQVTAFTPSPGQYLNTDVAQLQVQFSKAVLDTGPTGAHSVTNPAAYALVDLTRGQAVPITAVAYDATSHTATLTVAAASAPLNDGKYQLTVKGTDSTYAIEDLAGNLLGGGSDATDAFIVEKSAPSATLSFTPDILWPPNHKFAWVTVQARLTMLDPLDPNPKLTLLSITSNETGTPPLYQAQIGTDDTTFQLRSERDGTGDGRVYTIRYLVQNAAGSGRVVQGYVVVPHDQGHGGGDALLASLGPPGTPLGLGELQTSTVTQVNNLSLALNTPVRGSIAQAGQVDVYSFTGSAGQQLFFNAQSGSSSALAWSLTDPSGHVLFGSGFADRDLTLAASGTYYLTVDGYGTQTGAYQFELFNVPAATVTPVSIGQVVSGSLSVPGSEAAYTFSGTAGQQLFLDVQNSAGGSLAFSVPGTTLLAANNQNQGNGFTLPSTGTYTVVVGHGATLSAIGPYQFELYNVPPAVPQAITQNTPITGTLTAPGQTAVYTLQANLGQQLLFDVLNNPSNTFAFTLKDASGNVLFANAGGNQLLGSIPATGRYTLTVSAAGDQTGSFAFEFLDETSPVTSTPTAVVAPSGTLPAPVVNSRNVGPINFANLQDITGLGQVTYQGTFFNLHTRTLYAQTAITDTAPVALGNEIVLAFDAFTPPAVELFNPDAISPDGRSVILFGPEFGAQGLQPGATSTAIPVQVADPTEVRFGLTTSLLAPANQTPAFTSTPVTQATSGSAYQYQATAGDPDGDPLTFSLLVGPQGMTVNAQTGLVQWTPQASQSGNQSVTLQVSDGRGGTATQTFQIGVAGGTSGTSPGTLAGTVFNNANGLAGWTVFLDLNHDGTLDPGDPSAVTDAQGHYQFSGVMPGNYTLAEVLAAGWAVTAPAGGTYTVSLGAGQGLAGLDFDNQQVSAANGVPPGTLSGSVFNSAATTPVNLDPYVNNNLQTYTDGTYYPLGGTVVNVGGVNFTLAHFPGGGTGVLQTAPGLFASPGGGSVVDIPASIVNPLTVYTLINSAFGQFGSLVGAVEFFGTNGAYAKFDLVEGTNIRDHFNGFFNNIIAPGTPTTNFGGGVRLDRQTFVLPSSFAGATLTDIRLDGYGSYPTGEPFLAAVSVSSGPGGAPGLAGWKVYLDVDHNGRFEPGEPSAVTDANGNFSFTGLAPGTYTVAEVPQVNWQQTAPATRTFTVTVASAQTIGGLDFGNQQLAGANELPTITSTAPTTATVGRLYRYDVAAQDSDGDSLTFGLVSPPAGMAIDPASGTILWVPVAGEVGTQSVQVRVDDGRGGSALETFTVTVGASSSALTITSTPPLLATENAAYTYQVTAADDNGLSPSFALVNAPAGMAIDPSSGLLTWTPSPSEVGTQQVTIQAGDTAGNSAYQTYLLRVLGPNLPPTVSSTPVTTVVAGALYHYAVQASDGADTFTFALVNGPAGMSIDPYTGLLSWAPGAADVGAHAVDVRLTNDRGARTDQTFTLTVSPDTRPPFVAVLENNSVVDAGQTVRFQVIATDDVSVASQALTVNVMSVPLDANGNATFAPTAAGLYTIVATATDPSGNVGTATTQLRVIDPTDTDSPTVEISGPTSNGTVTYLTPIIGTVADPDLEFYRVEVSPANLNEWTLITQQSTPVVNGTLATFDPTLLQNGPYDIRVSAEDVSGNIYSTQITVNVTQNAKIGNFHLEYTDLSVPLAGIPITITRTYDTLQANQSGAFGFGWTLGVDDPNIRETLPPSTNIFNPPAFRVGTKIYLTDPAGTRVGFTFSPTEEFVDPVSGFPFPFGPVWVPKFTADPGVFDQLTVNDVSLTERADGTFGLYLFGFNYNPDSFSLAMKDGTVYNYSVTGGLQSAVDLNGNTLTFSSSGIVSSTGVSIQFVRDSLGRITQIIDPAGHAINYGYDGSGNLISLTNQVNATSTYQYLSMPAHYLSAAFDPLGNQSIGAAYGPDGRLLSTSDALGDTSTASYDLGNDTEHVADPNGNVTTLVYDINGNVLKKIGALGGVTQYTYDSNNNETSITDPNGHTTTKSYDSRGNVLTVLDALGGLTTYSYNQFNKVVTTTDADGHTVTNGYDSHGNLIAVTDAAGNTSTRTFDSEGRMLTITPPCGCTSEEETFVYASGPNPTEVINADGTFRTFVYNDFGEPTQEVDENGHATTIAYDDSGRPISSADALGNITYFVYNGADQLTAVTDPDGNTTQYVYDSSGRQTETINVFGGVTRTFYDRAGNAIKTIDPNGNVRVFVYDAENRETAENWLDANGNIIRQISFAYDAAGNLISASDPDSSYTFTYDVLNRVTSVDNAGTPGVPHVILYYRYDAVGNVLQVRDNSGVEVDSTYDPRNLLTNLVWQGGGIAAVSAAFAYDSRDLMTGVSRYSDVAGTLLINQELLSYNSRGLLTNLDYLNGVGQAFVQYQDIYDPAGQLAEEIYNGQTSQYSYDRVGQLIQALRSNGPNENFSWDANGNPNDPGYVIGRNNELLSDGSFNYAYDANGNMVQKTEIVTGNVTTLSYDFRNRLTEVEARSSGGIVLSDVHYVYDVFDRRIITDTNGTKVATVYNGNMAWADYDANGNVLTRYLAGAKLDQWIARWQPGVGTAWYLTDRLGSVRDLINAAGQLIDHISYSAFGTPIAQTNAAAGGRILFTGLTYDAATGLYGTETRWLNPSIMRFNGQDSQGLGAGDMNLYSYAKNSPANFVDPTGEDFVSEALIDSQEKDPSGLCRIFIRVNFGDFTADREIPGFPRPTTFAACATAYELTLVTALIVKRQFSWSYILRTVDIEATWNGIPLGLVKIRVFTPRG